MTTSTCADQVARFEAMGIMDAQIVLVIRWDDETEDGDHIGGEDIRHMDVRGALEWAMEDSRGNVDPDAEAPEGLDDVQNVPQFMSWLRRNYDCFVTTTEELEERKRLEERRKLEAIAASFLRKHGLKKIDSLEALDKLQEELDHLQARWDSKFDPEARAERRGVYACSGNRHNFYQDEEYLADRMRSDMEPLDRLQNYIAENFPIAWAEWMQTRKPD